MILAFLLAQILTCTGPCIVTVTEQDPIVEPAVLTPEVVTVIPATMKPEKVTKRPPIVTTEPAQTCWDGSVIAASATCPAQTQTCPDGSVIPVTSTCPPPPPLADITITGRHETQWFRTGLAAGTDIDATQASFYMNNCKNSAPSPTNSCSTGTLPVNVVPVQIEKSPGVTFNGGFFDGIIPQTYDWSSGYVDSSALRILESPNAKLSNIRITKSWDGIRFRIGSNNMTMENIHIKQARDDAIENDYRHSAVFKNIMINGALSCVALSPPSSSTNAETDGTGQVLRLENFYCKLVLLNQGGTMTHGSPFKAGEDGRDLQVVAKNIVLAMSTPTPNGSSRLKAQMERFTCEANCVFLNLSDTPLSSSHTWRTPRPNTTLFEGEAARGFWATTEADFNNLNPGLVIP